MSKIFNFWSKKRPSYSIENQYIESFFKKITRILLKPGNKTKHFIERALKSNSGRDLFCVCLR
jgi:predicted methyltransferase